MRYVPSTATFVLVITSILAAEAAVSIRPSAAQTPFRQYDKVALPPASAAPPISSALNRDGMFRQSSAGSFDPKGFRMTYGSASEPRFVPRDKADELVPSTSCNDGWHDGLPVNGVDGSVSAIAFDGAGGVYVGGSFTVAGNTMVNNIAKWDGTSWSALGSGMNGQVNAIAVSGTDVYAGGHFTTAGGTPANYVAKWNGSSWSPIGSGLEYPAYDIEVSGTDVYVGGGWYDNGTWAGYVAKWNGSNWSSLGSGMEGQVFSIGVSGSDVYAGGSFTTAGGTPANHVAKWNGTSWSALGSGPNGSVQAIAVSGTDVYAGGSFGSPGYVSKWNGSSWSALGSGMTNPVGYASVLSITVSGTDVYAGGNFTLASGTPANGIAKWNGSNWSALGSGLTFPGGFSASVGSIAVSGTDVYAAGYERLARWNGSNWSTLGSGTDSRVFALTVSGTDVYAGGYFTPDDRASYSRAAKWNGSGWTQLGSWVRDPIGTSRWVNDIAVSGTDVYIGGRWYDELTRTSGGYVFKWNGSNWSELGSGMNGDVLAIVASGSDVYAGGWFTTAGGTSANYIAKWNGSNWSSLGTGMNAHVYALSVSGTDLYAGGDFSTAGGIPANFIAKWNGTSWSALGSGPITSSFRNGRRLWRRVWIYLKMEWIRLD